MNNENSNRPKRRSATGMSLASVLAMGTVMTLFVTALLGMVMPLFRKTAELKHANTVRSMAELGMDYAVQMMNNSPGTYSSMAAGASSTISIPTSVIGNDKAVVSVRVQNIGNPPQTSTLYDPLLDATNPNSFRLATVTASYGATTKQTRALLQPVFNTDNPYFPYGVFGISSVVYYGQAGINSYNAPANRMLTAAEGGTLGKITQVHNSGGGLSRSIVQGGSHYEYPNPQSYYNKRFNIVANITGAKSAAMGSVDWNQIFGNVYSNGSNTAYIAKYNNDKGVVTQYTHSDYNGGPENVFGVQNGIEAGTASNGVIPKGDAKNSWVPQNTKNGSPDPKWTGAYSNWNPTPGAEAGGVSYPQPVMSNADVAPSGIPNLGDINLKNGAKLIFQVDPSVTSMPAPIGTVSGITKTVKIPDGNAMEFKFTSMSLSGKSSIEIQSSTQAGITAGNYNPIKLYLDSPGSSTAISVSNDSSINMTGITPNTGMNESGNNGVKNSKGNNASASNQLTINNPSANLSSNIVETSGSAKQLQIHSNANTTMVMQGNQRMIVYAPYADIYVGSTLDGNGKPIPLANDANFYGALTGQNVWINSATTGNYGGSFIHYDYNLKPPSTYPGMSSGIINPWSGVPPKNPGNLNGYRVVSWQEALNVNTANPSQTKWYF